MKKMIIVIGMLVSIIVTGCAEETTQEPKEVMEESDSKKVESKPAPEPEPEPVVEEENEDHKVYLAILEEQFNNIASVSYEEDSKTFLLLPTDAAFTNDLAAIITGTLPKSEWDNLVDSFASMSTGIGEGYFVGLLNPSNNEKILLIVSDGVVIMDAFDM